MDNRRNELISEYHTLFETNHTIKDWEVDIKLKAGAQIVQEKARPIPVHLQDAVGNELKKLIKSGHVEKADDINTNQFISPALDSRKLNDACIKKQAQMPNMEELISKVSTTIAKDRNKPLWITKIDLDYAYGQVSLSENAKKHCNFAMVGGEFTGNYRFLKGFYGLADMPPAFQQHIDKTLKHEIPAWLDDIIIVTRGTTDEHQCTVEKTMKRLEDNGYRTSKKKTAFFSERNRTVGPYNQRELYKTDTR